MNDNVVYFRTQFTPSSERIFERWGGTVPLEPSNVNGNITYRTTSSTPKTDWVPASHSEYKACLREGFAVVMNPLVDPR